MKSKPQVLIAAVLAIAFVALLGALRRGGTDHEVQPVVSRADTESSETGQTSRRTGISRISRTIEPQRENTPRAPKINIIPKEVKSEDFEAQKLRAFGESTIYGIIRGEQGKPLPGATVQLYEGDPMTKNPSLREAITDEQGSYTLTQINDRELRFILVARAEGYAPEAHFVMLAGEPMERDIRLTKGVKLEGEVRDAETSATIPGATVYYPAKNNVVFGLLGTISSGPAGQFSFPAVLPGKLRILAHKDGYHRGLTNLTAPSSNAIIPLSAGGATIRGVTVSRLTKKPEGGAKVVAVTDGFSDTTMSDKEDGTFEFTDMPGGEYQIYAIKGMPSQRQKFTLGDQEVKEGVEIVLPSDLLVTGKVINVNKSVAMPGVQIWYRGPSGKKSVISDEHGQFAFETLALDSYTMEVHEKNFLPVLDRKSTGVVESITRKVPANASSDEVIIKMRQVPAVEGNLRNVRDNGRPGSPARNVDVSVTYLQGKDMERVVTKSDVFGNFFVNLPSEKRGFAKIVAQTRNAVAAESVRIPNRRPAKMLMKRNPMRGMLYLVDKTALSQVRVQSKYLFPDGRPMDRAILLPGPETYTAERGWINLPVAERQKVVLTFHMPDGNRISKEFSADNLTRKRPYFIYDPVAGDVYSDMDSGQRQGRGSRSNRNGQNPGGNAGGQNRGNRDGRNRGKQGTGNNDPNRTGGAPVTK